MLLLARLAGVSVSNPTKRPEPGIGGALDQVVAQDRVDGGCALEQPIHAAHAVEQRAPESSIAQQMIVEKIEMAARQP